MGRSRVIPNSNDDDPALRSKRKKTLSGAENVESIIPGQGSSDGKKALYHCNYCSKDISGMIRIKCAVCPDFDLCIECFSVGAAVYPHKNNHQYRVIDNLSFQLISPDWNADEESLLLEGIEMYGLSNWAEVAEHVGTKSKSECIDHYKSVYLESPCFPLPDLSHVVGKNREELQAMGKEHNELKKALDGNLVKEESPSSKVKLDEQREEASEAGFSLGPSSTIPGEVKKPSGAFVVNDGSDGIKVEDTHSDRKVGEKKPRVEEGPSVTNLSGYNPKRQEFEIEYDNDAEQLLAEMEFKDADPEAERDLKIKVMQIYNRRLDDRKRRKDFVLERSLLYPDPFEKNLSFEEKQICQQYRVFMRFHSKEDHNELLRTVIEEHRILKKIHDLQEAKAAGCRSSAEAERFIAQKRKREAEENAFKMKETIESGSGAKVKTGYRGFGNKDSLSTESRQVRPTSLDDWDVSVFPGADLLSETEKRLCREIRILPSHYLKILQTMSMEVMKGNITKQSDAHSLFQVDPSKVDRVYDMLVKKGIAPPSE